jgi:hypothetical protein
MPDGRNREMENCNCQMTAGEMKALFESGTPESGAKAVEYLVGLLTSHDRNERTHGYELFKEAIGDALFCSCLNYGSLVGGFTHPLQEVLVKAIERWAEGHDG